MLNNVSLAGRLTRDAEVKHFDSSSITRFTLAVDKPKYKDKEKEVDFIDCSMWNADKLAPYLTKGKPITVIGSIQTRTWEDNDGNRRKAVEVKADRVGFLPDSNRSGGDSRQRESQEMTEVPYYEDDLPF